MNIKKILLSLPFFAAILFLSGCSLSGVVPAKNTMADATVIKSEDGGAAWNPKTKIDGKKTIAGVDVLSMAIKPDDPNIIYIGTAANAMFVTKDGAETWKQVPFANKVYGLVFDPHSPDIMYASGVLNGRAKIYKRLQEDQEWKEVYTEPADGTVISSLAIDKTNPQILFAGTSAGVIIKTMDGGQTWKNLKIVDNNSPIISIGFDSANSAHVFFGVFQIGVLETNDGGKNIEDITKNADTDSSDTSSVYTLATDPFLGGVAYIGTGGGVFRRVGDKWKALNIIESSKAFPIRAIAINPKNSREILYSSAKAIYKSVDSGATWSTFQLNTSKEISVLRYDETDTAKIYAGLRSF